VGGLVGGIKYVTAPAGSAPSPRIFHLDPYLLSAGGIKECFTLYNTGISRTSPTMLEDVVAAMYANAPATLFTLQHIVQLAHDCRDAIALRDTRLLGKLLCESQRANILLHSGATNAALEKLIRKVGPLAQGYKLAGAGGGGFALFVSPDLETAKKLRTKLAAEKGSVVRWSLDTAGLIVKAR
jgi:galactokinase/mevalonate kinase-like predicted kinase